MKKLLIKYSNMVKNVLVILLGLIASFIFTIPEVSAKEYHIIKLNIVAHIQEDGSVLISERRSFVFDGSFSFAFQEINKAGFDEISSIQAYDNDIPLTLSKKNEPGNFTISDGRRRMKVQWNFNAKNETRELRLDYKLTGALSVDTNWSEFFWTFVGGRWEKPTTNINIEIHLPNAAEFDEFYVWSRNNFPNEVIKTENGVITYTTERIPRQTPLRLQVIFPSRLIVAEVNADKPVNPSYVQSEIDRLREEEIRREARKEALAPTVRIVGFTSVFFSLVFTIYILFSYGRHADTGFQNPTFQDVPPGDYPPAIAAYLIYRYQVAGQFLSSTILDLSRRGYFKIRQEKVGKGTLFSPEKDEFYLEHGSLSGQTEGMRDWEITLYDYLKEQIDSGKNSFSKMFGSSFMSSKTYSLWSAEIGAEVKREEWYVHQPKVIGALVAVQLMILGIGILLLINGVTPVWGIITCIVSFLGMMAAFGLKPRNEVGQRKYQLWTAYRLALKEGKVSNNPELAGKHIVFGVAFGISGKKFTSLTNSLKVNEDNMNWLILMPGMHFNSQAFSTSLGTMVTSVNASISSSVGASSGSAGGGGGGGAG